MFSLQAILFDDKGQCLESIFIKSQVYFFGVFFIFMLDCGLCFRKHFKVLLGN